MIKLLLLLVSWIQISACTLSPSPPPVPVADPPEVPPASIAPAPKEPASQPASQPDIAVAPADDPVRELLDRLEQSAGDLQSFTADVFYQTEDALLGQKVTRTGSIIFEDSAAKNDPELARRFAILFDTMIENRRRRQREKHFIFSGRWIVEVDPQEKMFIKREVVAPGESFDPLKLGEGPFPLPIGQPRDEVLARFDVSLITLPPDGPLAKLAEAGPVHGLQLRPKSHTPDAEEYQHVDLFYDQQTLLPVGVNVIEINDDRKTARLSNVKRNPPLTADQIVRLSVDPPDGADWRISIQPW